MRGGKTPNSPVVNTQINLRDSIRYYAVEHYSSSDSQLCRHRRASMRKGLLWTDLAHPKTVTTRESYLPTGLRGSLATAV